MTLRKVSVGLEADVADFITGMEEASHQLSQVDRKVESLDRSLNKIPLDAARSAAAMKLLNGSLKDVNENIDRVGNRSEALTLLDNRIKSVRGEVRKLATEFERTGDIDVFHKLSTAQGGLQGLTNIRKNLVRAIEDGTKEAVPAFEKFGSAIESILPDSLVAVFENPYVLAAAGGLAVVLGSYIGATVGGAITAAAAIGVVALGVAGAAAVAPERIGKTWHEEISRIKSDWMDASLSFVGPTEAAIHRLGAAVHALPLDRILSNASKFVEPLSKGLAAIITGIGGGIDALVARAGPVINVLKQEGPEVGHAFEVMFKEIAGGSAGAADGLRDTLHVVEALIVGFGGFIRVTEDIWHAIHKIIDALNEVRTVTDKIPFAGWLTGVMDPKTPQAFAVSLDGAAHGLDRTADAGKTAEVSLSDLQATLHKTTITTDTLAGEMTDKLIGSMMSLDQANISVAASLDAVKASFKENHKALDIATEKGRANRTAVLASVQANLQLYDAQISAGMSAQDAAAAYDVNTKALEAQLRKAHLTQGEIDGLIGKYRGVPKNVNTAIAMQGLTEAINGLADLIRLINGIKSKDVYVRVHQTLFNDTTGQRVTGSSRLGGRQDRYGGIERRAATGGIFPASNPGTLLVAEPETQGEAWIPLGGITRDKAMGLTQVVGNSYGFNVTPRPTAEYVPRHQTVVMPPVQRFEELFIWMWRRLDQQGAFAK
jgi:hypothetical protein